MGSIVQGLLESHKKSQKDIGLRQVVGLNTGTRLHVNKCSTQVTSSSQYNLEHVRDGRSQKVKEKPVNDFIPIFSDEPPIKMGMISVQRNARFEGAEIYSIVQ